MIMKKGAMFGLDARIALAIFGALSVISGAALYSAIQESKAVSLLTEMREVGKAYEQYFLDTGSNPSFVSSDLSLPTGYFYKIENLVNNIDNKSGWAGPYLSYAADDSYHLNHPVYGQILMYVSDETNVRANGSKCPSGNTCYLWVELHGVDNDALLKSIDLKVDGSDSASSGSFIWNYVSVATKNSGLLKIRPIENPND